MTRLPHFMRWILLAVALALGGCSSLRSGGAPDPSFNVQADLSVLKESLGNIGSVKHYHEGEQSSAKRNAFIDARVALANLAYIQFITDLTADKQHLDTATDMLVLGLNLLGTTATGVRAKANLAAAAAGVSGGKSSVDKHYFYEKTTTALIAMMNAKRKEVLARIVEGARKPLTDYSFTQALADTYEYYSAGTVNAAIASLQADAASREAQADQKLANLGELKVLTDEQIEERRVAVNKLLAVLGADDLTKLKSALKLLGLEGLPQSSVPEARKSLQDNFRRVLRDKPELAATVKTNL